MASESSRSELGDGLIAESQRPWHSPMPWMKKADLDGVAVMLAQNLATMLVGAQLLHNTFSASGSKEADDIVYGKVLPAMGFALFIGGIFYALQAQGAARATGRTDFCSQPFGISTPGVFVFVSSIVIPVYSGSKDAHFTWQLACLANLVQGILEVLCSVIGPYILQCVSMAALLIALANIGFAFLLVQPLQTVVAFPVVGMAPLFILLLGLLVNVRIPKVPVCVVPLAVASALAWASGYLNIAGVTQNAPLLGLHLPGPCLQELHNIGTAFQYINLIIPVALTSSIGTLMCQQLAVSAGDEYSVRTTMFGDGLVTIVAAMCGCPFGFTVYVGHPAMKQVGASVGYNILTGVVALVLCSTGVAAMLLSLVPVEAFNAFVIFVGIILCVDALRVLPDRHWPAFVVGLIPGICSWCIMQAQSFVESIWPDGFDHPNFSALSTWQKDKSGALAGLYAMGNGYIVTAMCWCSIFRYLIDREFAGAAAWCLLSAVLSAFGLIHAAELSLPWQQNIESLQLQLAMGYATCGALFSICRAGQVIGWVPTGLREDEPDCVLGDGNESIITFLQRRVENKVTVGMGSFRRTI